ncbi:unnamed protein product [Merluccius merluccius]
MPGSLLKECPGCHHKILVAFKKCPQCGDEEVPQAPSTFRQEEEVPQALFPSGQDDEVPQAPSTSSGQEEEVPQAPFPSGQDEEVPQAPSTFRQEEEVPQAPFPSGQDEEVPQAPSTFRQDMETTQGGENNEAETQRGIPALSCEECEDKGSVALPPTPDPETLTEWIDQQLRFVRGTIQPALSRATRPSNARQPRADEEVPQAPSTSSGQEEEVPQAPFPSGQDEEVPQAPSTFRQEEEVPQAPFPSGQDEEVPQAPPPSGRTWRLLKEVNMRCCYIPENNNEAETQRGIPALSCEECEDKGKRGIFPYSRIIKKSGRKVLGMATMWDMASDMFSSVSLYVGLFQMVVA